MPCGSTFCCRSLSSAWANARNPQSGLFATDWATPGQTGGELYIGSTIAAVAALNCWAALTAPMDSAKAGDTQVEAEDAELSHAGISVRVRFRPVILVHDQLLTQSWLRAGHGKWIFWLGLCRRLGCADANNYRYRDHDCVWRPKFMRSPAAVREERRWQCYSNHRHRRGEFSCLTWMNEC